MPESELGLEAPDDSTSPHLLEAFELGTSELVVRELAEGIAAPQLDSTSEAGCREGEIALLRGLRTFRDQALEFPRVERVGREIEQVARRTRDDPRRRRQRSPEAGDVHLEQLLGGRRRVFAPQGIDQDVDRSHAAGFDSQHGEETPRHRGRQLDAAAVVAELDRTQDAKLH